jgi:tryptophanyl-tRNA synthetase
MALRALTGIKPTGEPHVGNWLGAIKPALSLASTFETYYFIADYHALNAVYDAESLRKHTLSIAATYLAFGLDPEKSVFYRQSQIPEVFELSWILACFTGKGLMNRAHSYKDAVAKNSEAQKDPDFNINMGLYTYPILMAADILLFSANIVPVGADQKQHVEIARDIAEQLRSRPLRSAGAEDRRAGEDHRGPGRPQDEQELRKHHPAFPGRETAAKADQPDSHQ